jgi:Domain of unknown function (DUF4398)
MPRAATAGDGENNVHYRTRRTSAHRRLRFERAALRQSNRPSAHARRSMAITRNNMFMQSHTNQSLPRALSALPIPAALVVLALITACASTPPPPTARLTAARTAIADAEKADAGRYASPELTESRDKLVEANAAVGQDHMEAAGRLAEQSRVEAELAMSKTGEAKAVMVNDEMVRSNAAIVEEMQHKSGAQQ